MANIGEVLRKYFDNKGIAQIEIADKLGVSKAYVNALFTGSSKFGKKSAEKWSEVFGFSKSFLLTGEGSMFVDAPVIEEAHANELTLVPLLPISAKGGSLNDFVSSVNLQDCEKIISPIKGADIAITISGDSMADEYPSGSIVLAKRINERAFIDWGKVYVLDTCNGAVVKTLTPSQKEDCVRCVSINPNPIYAPFEVALNDIYGVYRVLLCMSMK